MLVSKITTENKQDQLLFSQLLRGILKQVLCMLICVCKATLRLRSANKVLIITIASIQLSRTLHRDYGDGNAQVGICSFYLWASQEQGLLRFLNHVKLRLMHQRCSAIALGNL